MQRGDRLFFDVMKTHALIGRTFSAAEQKPGGPQTIVLGYALAASLFGAPASALQKAVHLNGLAFNVIGVMPPKFAFPEDAELWIPNDLFPDDSTRSAHNYRVIGRVKPGVSVQQAQEDMNIIATRLAKEYADDKGEGIRVTSLYDSADCVREYLESAARSRCGAAERDGDAQSFRRGARTANPAVAYREPAAGRTGWRAWLNAGGDGGENPARLGSGQHSAYSESDGRWRRAVFYGGSVACGGRAVRRAALVRQLADRSERSAETEHRQRHRPAG